MSLPPQRHSQFASVNKAKGRAWLALTREVLAHGPIEAHTCDADHTPNLMACRGCQAAEIAIADTYEPGLIDPVALQDELIGER